MTCLDKCIGVVFGVVCQFYFVSELCDVFGQFVNDSVKVAPIIISITSLLNDRVTGYSRVEIRCGKNCSIASLSSDILS